MKQQIKSEGRREPYLLILCSGCGQPLSLPACWDGKKIKLGAVPWVVDEWGVRCPRCAQDFLSKLPADAGDLHHDAAGKEQKILDTLDAHDDGLTVLEIESNSGLSRTTIYRRLESLERRGQIRRKNNKFFLS